MSLGQVIAMDGPAASGKSSVARLVARRLGWVFVNTGNMYRAATLAALRVGADVEDGTAVLAAFRAAEIDVKVHDGESVVWMQGRPVDEELKSEEVNLAVSHVSIVAGVRDRLLALQRGLAQGRDVVMEGRDIGTVVFPSTPWKFYIDASESIRAKRRGLQGQADSVRERDRIDSTRKLAPLKVAEDAVVIDSSHLTLDQVVDAVMRNLCSRGFAAACC